MAKMSAAASEEIALFKAKERAKKKERELAEVVQKSKNKRNELSRDNKALEEAVDSAEERCRMALKEQKSGGKMGFGLAIATLVVTGVGVAIGKFSQEKIEANDWTDNSQAPMNIPIVSYPTTALALGGAFIPNLWARILIPSFFQGMSMGALWGRCEAK